MKRKTTESGIYSSSSNDDKSSKAQKIIEEKSTGTLQISIKDLTTMVMATAQLPGDSLKLLDNYESIMQKVDWNQKNTKGQTLTLMALKNGVMGNTSLLDVLTTLPRDILKTINWNYHYHETDGATLFFWAIRLALVNRCELINLLLTLPFDFLKSIQWGSSISYTLSPTFLILSLFDAGKLPPRHLKTLLHQELLLCLDWSDEVIKSCRRLFNSFIVIENLSILPIATLKKFKNLPPLAQHPEIKNLLGLLIELKAQQPLSPASIDFCRQNSSQASQVYFLAAPLISDKSVEYYEKVTKTSFYYLAAQFKLAHLILPELNSTGPKTDCSFFNGLSGKNDQKQITSLDDEYEDKISEPETRRLNLVKAFGHACQWFYYNKKTPDEKFDLPFKVLKKIFLMDEPKEIDLSSDWQAKIKQFLQELAICRPIFLENKIEFFLEEIKEYYLKKQLNNLKASVETLGKSL